MEGKFHWQVESGGSSRRREDPIFPELLLTKNLSRIGRTQTPLSWRMNDLSPQQLPDWWGLNFDRCRRVVAV